MKNLQWFRLTRTANYFPFGSPGQKDPTARQGYYVKAKTKNDALRQMHEARPDETYEIS